MSVQTVDRPSVGEVNGLVDGISYHKNRHATNPETVSWDTPGLEITRLRLLTDPGFPVYDVSYCHGMLDGKHVNVELPFSQLPKRGMKQFLYAEARKTGCFISGLFNSISTLS